ncbi:MAG: AraC family transcriptional regulator [Clostridiales bacterium]|nr:AraC family transcriptional regulator [Clostridiales bacterium]
MKTTPLARSTDFPAEEAEKCSYFSRNHDMLIGPAADLFFHMQYVGHYITRRDYHIKRRLENSALLLLTLSGGGELLYRGKSYRLERGSCMLIDTNEPHEYYPLTDGWEFKYVHFWGGMSREYLSYAGSRAGPVHHIREDEIEKIENLIDSVFSGTAERVMIDYPGISGDIYSMITVLLSSAERKDISERPGGGSAVADAALFIRRNYAGTVSVEDIANAVNLSRSYLTEQFGRVYGLPPHEYLTMYRISAAKNLLLSTAMTITDIAERTGFRDVYTFSRVFRRVNGISPARYRKDNGA